MVAREGRTGRPSVPGPGLFGRDQLQRIGHLGRLAAGRHAIETPVGTITLDYDGAHRAAFENVASYRTAADVALTVDGVSAGRARDS